MEDGSVEAMHEPTRQLLHRETDTLLLALEQAERRIVAISFLVAKIISVGILLILLLVLEAGVVTRLWESDFPSKSSISVLLDFGTLSKRVFARSPQTDASPRL
jgi:hypothetical protein